MTTQRITITQVTLFTTITLLATVAIAYQLGQASYRAGYQFRNLINAIDGTGGPTHWIQLATNRLRPEFYLAPYSPFNSCETKPPITSELQGFIHAAETTAIVARAEFEKWLEQESEAALSNMTIRDLKQLAKEQKVKRYGNLTKAQLVLALS